MYKFHMYSDLRRQWPANQTRQPNDRARACIGKFVLCNALRGFETARYESLCASLQDRIRLHKPKLQGVVRVRGVVHDMTGLEALPVLVLDDLA